MQEKEFHPESISIELKSIYEEDQVNRGKIDTSQPEEIWRPIFEAMMDHDEIRLARVREMILNKELRTGADFYHAAMIFQHSPDIADYALAHLLALKSSEMGYECEDGKSPLWLAAAAKDRWLVRIGQLQDFGTQYTWDKETNQNKQYPVNPAITDEERKRWHVPPLNNED